MPEFACVAVRICELAVWHVSGVSAKTVIDRLVYHSTVFGGVTLEDKRMPKIIVNAFLTLDGIMQAPGRPVRNGKPEYGTMGA